MCKICGQPDYLRCNCQPQQAFCDQCDDDNKCLEVLDTDCVFYHFNTDKPSQLVNLGIGNKTNVTKILEVLDGLMSSNFNIPLNSTNTPSIIITSTGPANHNIKADVNISPDNLNQLEIRNNGLYAKPYNEQYKLKVDANDIPDFLVNQVQGGTDRIVSISITDQNGLLLFQPKIDLKCLIDELGKSPDFVKQICQIRQYCDEICPYIENIETEVVI